MKKNTKIKQIALTVLSAAIILSAVALVNKKTPKKILYAQNCTASSTLGNLHGYIVSETLGSDSPIFMNTESWNDYAGNPQSNYSFYSSYDRDTGIWSGRAWNKDIGWIDFDKKVVERRAVVSQAFADYTNNGGNEWGNWSGIIDLNAVQYTTQGSAGFIGKGVSGHYTGNPVNPRDDILVGLGDLDFSNVFYQESPCAEYVDLLLNGRTSLYQKTCPINKNDVKLTWRTTKGIETCTTDGGPWAKTGVKPTNYSGKNEGISTNIVEGTTQVLRLKCKTKLGQDVVGIATASCGEGPNVINPIDNVIKPIFIES